MPTQTHMPVELAMKVVNKRSHDSVDGQNNRYTQVPGHNSLPRTPDFNVVCEPGRGNVAYRFFCPLAPALQVNIQMRGCRGEPKYPVQFVSHILSIYSTTCHRIRYSLHRAQCLLGALMITKKALRSHGSNTTGLTWP